MSISEKDAVLREREAFLEGVAYERAAFPIWSARPKEQASQRYPLPKVTRPRVATDPYESDYVWSVRAGDLHFLWLKTDPSNWKRASGLYENLLLTPLPSRVTLWADLLANPTEEVEAEP
jgi:hypothetical protein